MRDPYAVVRSVMAKGFLQDGHWDPYDLYVEEHRPDIVEPRDHLGRAIRYVALWDEPISERVPLLRARDYDEWRHLGSVWGALLHVTGKEPDRGKVINTLDRKSGVEGKSVSVRVDLGGRRDSKTKTRQ